MSFRSSLAVKTLMAFLLMCALALAQSGDSGQTMRPVIRGRHAAVASMKAEATEAARQILTMGGNAFDAAVGGQAALGVTDFSLNGVGSDAVILVYDAREKKVYSINAEPRAPKLATIEWYEKNNGGKIPESDGLLSGGLPGVVDAWYTLLDRWGTMSFEQVLQPAIELAENGFPLSEYGASYIAGSKKILKYPTTVKIYLPNGRAPKAGEILKNPDLARTLKKLVEAEKANQSKGRHEALKAARDRFYKGDIAKELAAFSEANGGLFRYEDFAEYTAEVETPVSINYRGYQIYKNPSASQGPTELIALNLLEGYDLKALGPQQPGLSPHQRGGGKTRHGRPRKISGRHGLHQDSLRRPALERLCPRTPKADRSREGLAGTAPRFAGELHSQRISVRPPGPRSSQRQRPPRRRHQLHRGRRQRPQHG